MKRSGARKRQKARLWLLAAFITFVVAIVGAIALNDNSSTRRTARAIVSPEQAQRIRPAEAKELVDQGTALIYDTRSAEAYLAKHVTGALSFPEAEKDDLVEGLPADRRLVFY